MFTAVRIRHRPRQITSPCQYHDSFVSSTPAEPYLSQQHVAESTLRFHDSHPPIHLHALLFELYNTKYPFHFRHILCTVTATDPDPGTDPEPLREGTPGTRKTNLPTFTTSRDWDSVCTILVNRCNVKRREKPMVIVTTASAQSTFKGSPCSGNSPFVTGAIIDSAYCSLRVWLGRKHDGFGQKACFWRSFVGDIDVRNRNIVCFEHWSKSDGKPRQIWERYGKLPPEKALGAIDVRRMGGMKTLGNIIPHPATFLLLECSREDHCGDDHRAYRDSRDIVIFVNGQRHGSVGGESEEVSLVMKSLAKADVTTKLLLLFDGFAPSTYHAVTLKFCVLPPLLSQSITHCPLTYRAATSRARFSTTAQAPKFNSFFQIVDTRYSSNPPDFSSSAAFANPSAAARNFSHPVRSQSLV
ncbi:hypothetical protein BDP27DRAFT_1427714 [Rhodocollybia butyracea]|uniref:Uncharacterized protein n=1 Tax=Rhodocollybia butyracea TaxID=206335 RepID=A0A9P5U1N8_9AGAR|nr:hypothetical protein BDP27DRAFT_1427714 [Rhodocollybia butyracea]